MASGTTIKSFVAQKQRCNATISAQNQFTVNPANSGTTQASTGTAGTTVYGPFAVLISGSFTATISIQRSADLGVTWQDVTIGIANTPVPLAVTAPCILQLQENSRGILYRVGCKTGNYTSGSPFVEIEQ